jgi:aspartate/methionine/tyrosine aminotransferase
MLATRQRFGQSARLAQVQPPVIPIIHGLIRQYPDTISLGQGVVYYGPPPEAEEALRDFWAEAANHRYGAVWGIPPLREALIAKLHTENGIRIGDDRQLVVTAGGNMAFFNALLAIADAGDEVILVSPYYFNHEMAIAMANCTTVTVPADNAYQLDVAAIADAITSRTRAVVTISPNNPTGAVYPRDDLQEVNELCAERGIYHVHDEAYEYFTYGEHNHFSPGSLPDAGGHTISLFSLSKSYGFASWRIGYMTIPPALYDAVAKIQDTVLICPPLASQVAALGALEAGRAYCLERRRQIEQVRTTALRTLAGLGYRCEPVRADGAFYMLLRLRHPGDPMELVKRLVIEHRVAVLPGTAFGLAGCSLRIGYGALTPRDAGDGIERLVRGLLALT